MSKTEYGARDSKPVVLYGKKTEDDPITYPILIDADGRLSIILKDSVGTNINPSSEESIILLRRILKVLESNSIVDNKQRQRVVIEGIGTASSPVSTEINASLPVSGAILGTSIAGQTVAILPTMGTPYYQNTWEGPVDQRWRVAEDSHISYQLGIRNKLTFS